MLQTQTVTGAALDLLKALMAMPELASFALVGGTNLSLRFGHRRSIDIDLFTNDSFHPETLYNQILTRFPDTILASQSETMLFLYIGDVKTDSVPDIAAMKLSAIARRGVKKDFWDIAELLDSYSIAEMISFYKAKYSSHDILHLVRSLVYFEDAEMQKDPEPLKKMTWKKVKKKVQLAVRQFIDNQL
ncbi:MAG: nucleotidyl transferase AbiEii/AbiGii toxin family protein [Saprospiraceae bacterium]|nr:nucleotidyl transferase AbiEii/AbiGii toxin family protein [Saprospiraceae bacterium]